MLIIKYARVLRARSPLLGRFVVDKEQMLELILLVSGVLEASDREKSRNADYPQDEGIKVMSDLLLVSQTFSSFVTMQLFPFPRVLACICSCF